MRVLVPHLRPDRLGQIEVEPRQHHRAPGRFGHRRQQAGRGRRRSGGAGGDENIGGGMGAPLIGKGLQQGHSAGVDVDQTQGLQADGPRLRREAQHLGGYPPVPGDVALHQLVQA